MEDQRLVQRLLKSVAQVRSYHNPNWAREARKVALTPEVEDELEINATIKVSENPSIDLRDALAIELMNWFKNSFFTWFKAPEGSTPLPTTSNPATGDRIENYRLPDGSTHRFERFNDPLKLIQPGNRQGRCGEWANCFCFLAAVMGFEVRYVCALYEDHVWAEIYSRKLDRWIHFDPCENSFDKPLLYELGWGKKMSYVIAFEVDLVSDVSKKYRIDHDALLAHQIQAASGVSPDGFKASTKFINIKLKNELKLSDNRVNELRRRRRKELQQFEETGKIDPKTIKKGQFSGRQNADVEWVRARGEGGSGSSSKNQPNEMKSKPNLTIDMKSQHHFKYFSAQDEFLVCDDTTCNKSSDLLKNAYRNLNMFRKVEQDWKKCYICREEGADVGYLALRFQFEKPVSAVTFKNCDIRSYKHGQPKVALTSDSLSQVYQVQTGPTDTDDQSNHQSQKIAFDAPVKYFLLHFHSSDKETDESDNCQWQHCQYFRDDLGSKRANLEFEVE